MSAPVLQSEAQLRSSGGSVAAAAAATRDPAERPARAAASSARTPQPGPGCGRSPAPGQAEVLSHSRGPHLASFLPSPSPPPQHPEAAPRPPRAADGQSSRCLARRKRPASGGQFGPPNPKRLRRGAARDTQPTGHTAHRPRASHLPKIAVLRRLRRLAAAGRQGVCHLRASQPSLRRCEPSAAVGSRDPAGNVGAAPGRRPAPPPVAAGRSCPAPQRCPSAAPARSLRRPPSRSPPGEVPLVRRQGRGCDRLCRGPPALSGGGQEPGRDPRAREAGGAPALAPDKGNSISVKGRAGPGSGKLLWDQPRHCKNLQCVRTENLLSLEYAVV